MNKFLIREKRRSGTRIFHIAPRRKGVKGERVLRRLPMVSEFRYRGEMGDTEDKVCDDGNGGKE